MASVTQLLEPTLELQVNRGKSAVAYCQKRTFLGYCLYSFFFSSRRRHTRFDCDWSSDVCSSDLFVLIAGGAIGVVIGLLAIPVNAAIVRGPVSLTAKIVLMIAVFGVAVVTWFVLAVDRKSTRLNSSHSQISYAVFCLKKKTNNIRKPDHRRQSAAVIECRSSRQGLAVLAGNQHQHRTQRADTGSHSSERRPCPAGRKS